MIFIDVLVPVIGKSFDFSLDEKSMSVSVCIEEIVELIGQREGFAFNESTNNLVLLNKTSERVLDKNCTLEENRVKSGSTLILV